MRRENKRAGEITKRQIWAIWALAHRAGLKEEDLRSLIDGTWSKRSLRSLTRQEAGRMIEHLLTTNGTVEVIPTQGAEIRGSPSMAQMAFMEKLIRELEWDRLRLYRLARRMYGVRHLEDLNSRKASGLIEALKAIRKRSTIEDSGSMDIRRRAA
jgi:hypothetical protein